MMPARDVPGLVILRGRVHVTGPAPTTDPERRYDRRLRELAAWIQQGLDYLQAVKDRKDEQVADLIDGYVLRRMDRWLERAGEDA